MGTGPIADGQARAESDRTESDTADFDIVVAGSGAAGMIESCPGECSR